MRNVECGMGMGTGSNYKKRRTGKSTISHSTSVGNEISKMKNIERTSISS